jgi:GntR family transcriptional regulator
MTAINPIRQSSLSTQINEILVEKLRNGTYPPESKMPTENQLAEEFKVSRATIRSAFDRLEAMGLIARRQGIGTFVRSLSTISNPLNQFIDFFELIEENGYEPGFEQLYAALIQPTSAAARSLGLDEETQVLKVEKVFYANKNPIIFCTNYIPDWVYRNAYSTEGVLKPGVTEPILSFLEKHCQQKVSHYISRVRADLIRNCPLPELFQKYDPDFPALIIEEVGFNDSDRPIHLSIEIHPGNHMDFKLIRSR